MSLDYRTVCASGAVNCVLIGIAGCRACDEPDTKKEEVVYVNLNGDGSVKESTIRLMNF